MLKIIGAGMIIAAGYLYGCNKGNKLKLRLEALKQLKKNLYITANHISYSRMSLGEAFYELSFRCGDIFKEFFKAIAIDIDSLDKKNIREIFDKNIDLYLKDSCFNHEDMEKLKEFANILGYQDVELQENNIKLYLSQLETDIEELSKRIKEECKVYKCLYTTICIFITIVII